MHNEHSALHRRCGRRLELRVGARHGPQPCSPHAFDSSDLDARARNTLELNARCIHERDAQVRVVGMTDSRGTEEYNLALGDRRARSTASYLSSLGVDRGRASTTSVGEELARGEEERTWAEDRRADLQLR